MGQIAHKKLDIAQIIHEKPNTEHVRELNLKSQLFLLNCFIILI